VHGLGRGREPIGLLVDGVALVVPGLEAIPGLHSRLHPAGECPEVSAEMRLHRRDGVVTQQPFIGIVEQFPQSIGARQWLEWPELLAQHHHHEAVLGDGQGQVPA